MATETQRHRVSKTLTVSAGRDEIFQGAHDVAVRRDDAASSVEHRGINRARRVLFARSRFLCASVLLTRKSFYFLQEFERLRPDPREGKSVRRGTAAKNWDGAH